MLAGVVSDAVVAAGPLPPLPTTTLASFLTFRELGALEAVCRGGILPDREGAWGVVLRRDYPGGPVSAHPRLHYQALILRQRAGWRDAHRLVVEAQYLACCAEVFTVVCALELLLGVVASMSAVVNGVATLRARMLPCLLAVFLLVSEAVACWWCTREVYCRRRWRSRRCLLTRLGPHDLPIFGLLAPLWPVRHFGRMAALPVALLLVAATPLAFLLPPACAVPSWGAVLPGAVGFVVAVGLLDSSGTWGGLTLATARLIVVATLVPMAVLAALRADGFGVGGPAAPLVPLWAGCMWTSMTGWVTCFRAAREGHSTMEQAVGCLVCVCAALVAAASVGLHTWRPTPAKRERGALLPFFFCQVVLTALLYKQLLVRRARITDRLAFAYN